MNIVHDADRKVFKISLIIIRLLIVTSGKL